jgi:hypothetical protein
MVRVTGAIPRIEAQETHIEFINTVAPPYAMLPIDHADRLANDGDTAASIFPEQTQIFTTTTIADDRLDRLSWEKECDIIERFAPAFHIPADHAVYGDDPPEKRANRARRCAAGTLWMADQLDETEINTEIIPLVKGVTETERTFGYRACETLETDVAAVYVAQYFTVSGSGGHPAIFRLLEAIETETDASLNLVVIGLLSTYYLSDVPANVIAAAGLNTWLDVVAPRTSDSNTMREAYQSLVDDVDIALRNNRGDTESTSETNVENDSTAEETD